MVGTVMKYEFLRTRWPLACGWGLSLFMGLAAMAAAHIAATVAAVPMVFGLIAAVAVPFATQIYLAIHLYRTTFGRRGYFELTIPVRSSTLIATKYLWACIVSVVALGVSVLTLWLLGLAERTLGGDLLSQANAAFEHLLHHQTGLAAAGAVFILLSYLASMAQYYFCVTVGSEAWINKSGGFGPVIVFLILYVVMQVIALLMLLIPPLYDPVANTWQWVVPFTTFLGAEETPGIPIVAIIAPLIVSVALFWRALVSVSRKLELR